MPECATGSFTDLEDYQTSLPGLTASLVVTQSGLFEAQLTWAKLSNFHLLRAHEALPRVAYLSLPAGWLFASFATRPGSKLFWDGLELASDDIVLHSPCERMHQRTMGPVHWGFVAVKPSFYARYGGALVGRDLQRPTTPLLIRPRAADLDRLLRLHGRVGRLIETRPAAISHPEVGRSLDHELLQALVACLADGEARRASRITLEHEAVLARLEAVLANCPDKVIPIPELCRTLNVLERTLRNCCAKLLGFGPRAYMNLRRLKLARVAILQADPVTTEVREIAKRFGFKEMGRFAAVYRASFGETPSRTLRRANFPR